jgi:hypothetical protein
MIFRSKNRTFKEINMANRNEALHLGDLEEAAKFYGTLALYGTMVVGARVVTFVADTLRGPSPETGPADLAAEPVVAE